MDLELPYGPWTRLASAEWGGFPVGLYVNSDKVLMLILYERHGDDAAGMLVSLKKVFVTDLDLTKTLQTQKREMTLIAKASMEGTTRFLMVGSTPAYCSYSQEALVEAMGKQMGELRALTQFTQDLAQAYKANAKELASASDEEVQQLLGDPFLLLALYNPSATRGEETKSSAKIPIGLNSKGDVLFVPLSELSTAVILGGERQARLHLMHLLCEGALQANVPCLLFDSQNSFAGLSKPNQSTVGFTQNKMTPMPLGFPFAEVTLGKGLFIDLSAVPSSSFLETFGLQETEVGKVLQKVLGKPEVSSLPQLINEVKAFRESRDATQYSVNRTLRALRVLELRYPGIFGKNQGVEVLVPWHEGIGKVFRVNTSGYPPAVQYLLVSSLLRAIPFPKGKAIKLLVGFDADLSEVYTDVLGLVSDLRAKSAGFLLQAGHELDVEAVHEPSAKIEVTGSDAVATIGREKPLRFIPRPGYTECTENRAEDAPAPETSNAKFKLLQWKI